MTAPDLAAEVKTMVDWWRFCAGRTVADVYTVIGQRKPRNANWDTVRRDALAAARRLQQGGVR